MAFYQSPTNYRQQQQQQQQDVEDVVDFLQTYPEVDFPQSQHAHLEEVTTTTTTANPAAGDKRTRNDKFGLKEYTVVAKKLRRLEQHQLQTIGGLRARRSFCGRQLRGEDGSLWQAEPAKL